MKADIAVIGAGTVGAAIAWGLAARGQKVLLLDGDDGDFRAARANFGLVWQQGKGFDFPPYQALTRRSVAQWRRLSDELADATGIDLNYEQNGGLVFCLGDDAFDQRRLDLQRLHNQWGETEPDWEMIERPALERLLPKAKLGPDVVGASFGRHDGHTNPLRLLSALHGALVRAGGELRHHAPVGRIERAGSGFELHVPGDRIVAQRIVIAAGLGSPPLARQVGMEVPLRPERGQILVTERVESFLPLPASGLRQTAEGTVMIGATKDDPGFDVSTTGSAAAQLSRKTARIVPALARATVVRQWAGLRVMTPDSYPIYAQSESHPGAFVALCHSGVTLAAFHANELAGAIADGAIPDDLRAFHQDRFDVSQAA